MPMSADARVPYDPRTFRALTFHDAVAAFRDGSDTPRAYLERCLETVALPVSSELDLLIELGGSEAAAEERALEEQDLGMIFLENPLLDTRPILTEQIQLGVPMKPLCKEDCAGLCSSCGADLNQGPCGCREVTDPRWGALAALEQERSDQDPSDPGA